MKAFEKDETRVQDGFDLARLLGLPADAGRAEISRAFGREARCEADLVVEAEEILTPSATETWEIVIRRALPRPVVELRRDGRGAWLSDARNVPQAVLEFFDLREDRSGRIVSLRSWKAWHRMRWLPADARRLKSRHGTICAIVEVGDVSRPTGRRSWSLRISSLLDPPGSREEQLPLPVATREIVAVLDDFRARAEAALAAQ